MRFSNKPLKEFFKDVKIERYFVKSKSEEKKITYHITINDPNLYLGELRVGKIIQKVKPTDKYKNYSEKEENIVIKLKDLPKNKLGYSNAKVKARIHYSAFKEKEVLEEKYFWGFCNLIEDKSGLVKKVFDIRNFLNKELK